MVSFLIEAVLAQFYKEHSNCASHHLIRLSGEVISQARCSPCSGIFKRTSRWSSIQMMSSLHRETAMTNPDEDGFHLPLNASRRG